MRGAFASLLFMIAMSRLAGADSRADKAKAKAKAEAGTKLFVDKKYDKSAALYQDAYDLDPQPNYLYAAAQAQRLGGNCTAALATYKAYVLTRPAPADEMKAKKNIERCEEDVLLEHPPTEQKPLVVQPVTPPIEPRPITPPSLTTARPAPAVQAPVAATSASEPRTETSGWTSDTAGHVLVIGGLGAAAAGVVFYLGGEATIKDNNAAPTYEDFVNGRDELDGARTKRTIGISAMAVGGALVLGGIIHYALHTGSRTTPTVSASVSSQASTVIVTRSF